MARFSVFICYVLYTIVFIQNVFLISEARYKKPKRCHKPRKYRASHGVSGLPDRLLGGSIVCTAPQTVFEIKYSNGTLCNCSKASKYYRTPFSCEKELKLKLSIMVSTNSITFLGYRCDINLYFYDPIGDRDIKTISLLLPGLKSSPRNIISTTSSKISSTVVSSNVVPYYSAEIIGFESTENLFQTPVLQSTTMSIQHTRTVILTTSLASRPVRMTSSASKVEVLSTSAVIQATRTSFAFTSSSSLPYVTDARKRFQQDFEFIRTFDTTNVDIHDEVKIRHVLQAATNLITTNKTTPDEKQDPGMHAVEVLQDLGNSISRQLVLGNESSATFEEVTEDLVFGVAVINATSSYNLSFPSQKHRMHGDEKIIIPSSVFDSNSDKAYFVGIIFKAYREMRNSTGEQGFVMGTKVINAVVSPPPNDHLTVPVEMIFKKNIGQSFAADCSFWIENSSLSGEHGRWSTRQCFRTFENDSHVKCACHHLTNFAVLFKVTDDQISEEDTFRLVIITYIGLGLSILGCLLTFMIYLTLQTAKTDRAVIHTNLVFALGIADVIFLVTVALKPVENSCLALAMLTFYFYLAVFFWMLVEGIYIYLMVIKVFRGNVARRRRIAYLVGWGCPLLVAVITYAILTDDVVSKYHCWLSVESGAIWAFVGPGLFTILVNLIILLGVIRTTWATFADDKEYGGLKSATRTFGAVIPILGITWVFGVMAFNESSIIFQYIFAITNSIQGALIFVLYCLVNKEVRNELLHRVTVWRTRRDVTSSSAGRRNILTSTQSGQRTQERPQELKEKRQSIERSYLLTDTTQSTGKEPEVADTKEWGTGGMGTKDDRSFDMYGVST